MKLNKLGYLGLLGFLGIWGYWVPNKLPLFYLFSLFLLMFLPDFGHCRRGCLPCHSKHCVCQTGQSCDCHCCVKAVKDESTVSK
ncbi:MAG: hypothetical protein V1707_00600 [bacterium]